MAEYKILNILLICFAVIISCSAHQFRNKRQADECSTSFVCKTNGDCVRFEQVCDGQKDCTDGSDEASDICVNFETTKQPYFGKFRCRAPAIPNGKAIIIYPSPEDSNRVANAGGLRFFCNPGYKLYKDIVPPSCIYTDNWLFLPSCKRDCSPLVSTSLVTVTCSQNCSEAAPDGTTASFTCKEYYKPSKKSAVGLYCSNGVWNDTFFECEAECGKPFADDFIEKIIYDKKHFPWQVSISNASRVQISCKGALITPSIVLSAASCFTDSVGKRYPANLYYVRTVNVEDDTDNIQTRDVRAYFIPQVYKGRESKFEGELAVVVLKKAFEMTEHVQPICIDWDNIVEPQEFSVDKLQKIAQVDLYHKTYITEIAEAKVRIHNWRFIDYKECKDVAPKNKAQWITKDKFCIKSTNGDSFCDYDYKYRRDTGDGIVFADKNNKYYLRGILGDQETLFCNGNAMYTDIYKYKDFITEIVKRNNDIRDECGELTSDGETYVVNGQNSLKNSFPWHIGLYRCKEEEYEYRCGGSIISPALVVTAAHCITTEVGGPLPAEEFYVAAGKYYSDYNSVEDTFAQKRRVKDYRIPSAYRGYQSNYAGDLAVIILKYEFQLTNVVKPVCVDWKTSFEAQHLQPHKIGSVVGWGSTNSSIIKKSEELKQLNTPFVDVKKCLDEAPVRFRRWITSDKFCAGYTNGSSVCKGDSGGGLIFQRNVNNKQLFYIRGVVSVGPLDSRKFFACNNFKYGVYTKVSAYINFISDIKKEIDNIN